MQFVYSKLEQEERYDSLLPAQNVSVITPSSPLAALAQKRGLIFMLESRQTEREAL